MARRRGLRRCQKLSFSWNDLPSDGGVLGKFEGNNV